jgi:hypothetical protein
MWWSGWLGKDGGEVTAIDVGPPFDGVLDVVLPTRLRTSPRVNAPMADETLQPGKVKAGDRNIAAIRQGRANGADWYQFDFREGIKRYVETHRIPPWAVLDADIDLVRPVRARRLPLADAELLSAPLAPDSLAPSRRQFGSHRTGTIDKVLWYRIAQSGFEAFFSEPDAAGKLARWAVYPGCLHAKQSVRAQRTIDGAPELEQFFPGEPLRGVVQSADVQGHKWIRYLRNDGSFGYLRLGDLEPCVRN